MSGAFEWLCDCIRRLDVLDDGPEADALRDEMDGPWLAMSDEEKLKLAEFSESLYEGGASIWNGEGS